MATKNEKYFRLGILGCGRWGINHVKTAHHLFREQLALVSDPNPVAKDKVMAVSESIPFTADPDQMFEDPSINAVIVATPAETHYSVVKRLLLKGKNVLVEKPITLHSSEARELIAVSEERELKLMVRASPPLSSGNLEAEAGFAGGQNRQGAIHVQQSTQFWDCPY